MKKNIILIGFMGSGKSTIAKELAKSLDWHWLDIDHLIEDKFQCNITDLFKTKGAHFFREQETQILKDLLKKTKTVISTGGGIILKPENHQYLKKLGTIIWLKVNPDTILQRLKNNKTRPLLETKNKEAVINNLLKERIPLYQNITDLEIETDNKGVSEIVIEIINNQYPYQ
ncbi:MAG: shikimate kinase [Candidatus Margulisiibacteriota bacterium]|jgi:shikimate kinase